MRLSEPDRFYKFGQNQRGIGLRPAAEHDDRALFRGIELPTTAVPFRYNHGSVPGDLIMGGSVQLLLISERIQRVLRDGGFTGWATYPVAPTARRGIPIEGYAGLAITGRAGLPLWEYGERFTKRFVERGPDVQMVRGMHFDLDTWDGSDLFTLSESAYVIVTAPVAQALTKAKVRNVRLVKLGGYEITQSTLDITSRRQTRG